MPASTYVGNAVLNGFLRGVAITVPAAVYVSLHTDDPGLTGTDEVSTVDWPAYERVHASLGGAVASGFSASTAKESHNLLDLLFAAHDGASNVSVTHVGFWDAPTGGNFLFPGTIVGPDDLPTTKVFSPSDEPVIHPNEILVTVT